MAYEYTNRRGDVYILQAGKTRTGKPRYYFGRKMTGTPVDSVPAEYEVFEPPDRAQVYLRKARPTDVAEIERQLVVEEIRRAASVEHFIVDIERDSLIVYLPDTSGAQADELIRELAGPGVLQSHRMQQARDRLIQRSDYSKMLRFALVDKQERLFQAYRWCFRGSIDDWIMLSGPAPLSDLVGDVAKHLGAESFYDLM